MSTWFHALSGGEPFLINVEHVKAFHPVADGAATQVMFVDEGGGTIDVPYKDFLAIFKDLANVAPSMAVVDCVKDETPQ